MVTKADEPGPREADTSARRGSAHDSDVSRALLPAATALAVVVLLVALALTSARAELAVHALAFVCVNLSLRLAMARVGASTATRLELLRSLVSTGWIALMCHLAGPGTPLWALSIIELLSAHQLFRSWPLVAAWQLPPVTLAPAVLYLDGASASGSAASALVLLVTACMLDVLVLQLRARNEALELAEQAARAFASELRESYDSVLEAGWARSFFLANMSHELRTPMNAVLGMSGLLADSHLDRLQRERVDIIQDSARELLELIDDILDYSMLEAGQLTLERAPFDLRACVESSVERVSSLHADAPLTFSHDIASELPAAVLDDQARVQQILLNLLNNAVKFTERGEISVRVEVTPLPASDELELCLAVRDTGIGIAKSELDRLFDSFVQIDPSSTRAHGGAGLGLAICRRLAELLEGRLEVESELGEGSCFSFTWRTRAAEPAELAPPTIVMSAPAERAPLEILLVEDNRINQMVATAMLERLGYQADLAHNGLEAIDAAKRRRYDLILMDVQMPELDGLEATRRIRAELPADAQPTIVALTANVSARDRRSCIGAGMNDHLAKPIDIARLTEVLAEAVTAHEPRPR